ncbi:MAG: HEPN domain-containing protein [Candidatus Muiribacteriota bacterium]|jgi:HEPN domain-containing protein
MEKIDLINYWIKTSDNDFKTMQNLFSSNDYSWSLFVGHLVIEKLLKALYIKEKNETPPFTHDLNRLANKIGIEINDKKADKLDMITKFNISGRYPDYKMEFRKICTKEFTENQINEIKDLRQWLKKLIKQ